MSSVDALRRLRSEIEHWGYSTTHELVGGDLIYAESRSGNGMPIEMIVRDGCVTFISLGEYFWADYANSDAVQEEAVGIIRSIVFGGAAIMSGKNGCQLICGSFLLGRSADEEVLREWAPWRPTSSIYPPISLPIRC